MKIVFISHQLLGDTGKKTGFWLRCKLRLAAHQTKRDATSATTSAMVQRYVTHQCLEFH